MSPARLASVLLAVAAPAALLAFTLGEMGAVRERPPSELAKMMDGRLAAAKAPAVVVLGNSKARTDIDPDTLARALGVSGAEVARLDIGGSTAPTWYAVLENRVYAHGYTPRLVIVYAPLTMTLDTQVHGAVQRMRLEEQLGAVEPVLGPKVLGREGGAGFWDRVRERRTELHTSWMDEVRNTAVGLFAGWLEGGRSATAAAPSAGVPAPPAPAPPAPLSLAARGESLAEPALERLFGEQADGGTAERHRVIPVAEVQGPAISSTARGPREGLLPDFAALAAAHGARLVVVRAPLAPGSQGDDAVPPELLAETVDVLNGAGAGWIDLSGLPFAEDEFRDALHMNGKGRARLSAALVEELERLGAFGDGPLAAARPPLRPVLRITGTPPTLPELVATRNDSACGRAAPTPGLVGLGNEALFPMGLGPVSPLQVLEDGAPLRATLLREEFADRCAGARVHFGREVRFSPTSEGEHDFRFGLDPDRPSLADPTRPTWWLYPGETQAFDVEGAWSTGAGPEPRVRAVVRVLRADGAPLDPATPPLRLRVVADGAAAEQPLRGEGNVRVGRLPLPAQARRWSVELVAPPEGEFAVLDALWVEPGEGDRQGPLVLVGRPPAPLRLLGEGTRFTGDPPALPAPTPEPARAWPAGLPEPPPTPPTALRRLPVPGFAFLDDLSTRAALGVTDCSPLRPAANGRTLTAPHTALADIDRHGGGRYAHVGDALWIGSANELAPAEAAWSVGLEPSHLCEAGYWLYPGTTLVAVPPRAAMLTLARGAQELVWKGGRFGDGAGPLSVELLLRGATVLSRGLDPAELAAGPVRWEVPVPPNSPALELRVTNPLDGAWVLLSNVTLEERLPEPAGP